MRTLPDGPYAYRVGNQATPIICEVVANHVWEVGDQHMRPLSHYGGKFVRLIEAVDVNEAGKHGEQAPGG